MLEMIRQREKMTFFFLMALIVFFFHVSKSNAQTFTMNLYYDIKTKNLTFDKLKPEKITFDEKAEIDIRNFFEEQDKTKGQFEIRVVDAKNFESTAGSFDKKDGSFQFTMPAYSIGKTMNIYDTDTGEKILSADIFAFNRCDSNGICEFERGESLVTCIDDCGISRPSYSEQTRRLFEESGGEIKDKETGEIFLKEIAVKAISSEQISSDQKTQPGSTLTPVEKTEEPSSPQRTNIAVLLVVSLLFLAVGTMLYFIYRKFIRDSNND